jgi:hypothetical protein
MAVLDHVGEFWTDANVVWKWLFPPGSAAPGDYSPVFLIVTILTMTGVTGRAIRGGP